MVLKRTGHCCCCCGRCLCTFATDAASELDVLWHDGDTLGVDGAQVGIFEEANQVRLARFLQCHDGGALEAQVGLEILRNFTHKTLERQLADEQLGALLVAANLTQCDGAGAITMGFLHAAGGGRTLASGLGCQLLARRFASGGFASGLLGTSHVDANVPEREMSVECMLDPPLCFQTGWWETRLRGGGARKHKTADFEQRCISLVHAWVP